MKLIVAAAIIIYKGSGPVVYRMFTSNHLDSRRGQPPYFPVFQADFLPLAHRVILDFHLMAFVQNEEAGAAFAGRASDGDTGREHYGFVPLGQCLLLLEGKHIA